MRARLALALVVAVALSCAPTTHVVAEWKDPQLGHWVIDHPLVVFQHPSEAMRRSVEDALAKRIPGAVPAYQIIDTSEIFDVDAVQRKVAEAHFDTVMITHLVDVHEKEERVPSQPYPHPSFEPAPLWESWTGWSRIDEPTYLEKTTVVTLESRVYSVENGDDALLWAGRSETFDPHSLPALARSVAGSAVKAMRKDGIIVAARDQDE